MDKKRLKEILSSHADELVESSDQPHHRADDHLPDDEEEELTSLLKVAERVKSTLTPITPSSDFETELKRELLTTAHLRKAQGYVPPNPERDLMIMATFVGLMAMFAGILIMMRLRG